MQSKADHINRLQEECKTSQSKCTELQQQHDLDVSNARAWKKQEERLEATIISMKATYASSTTARAEQETHISSMISQLRTLIQTAGGQCDRLQTAYSESTKVDLVNTSMISVESKMEVDTRVEEREVKVEQTRLVHLASGQSNVS